MILGNMLGGLIVGGGLSAINNGLASVRESQSRAENYLYGERAAQNADARTRALYNDLQSPSALLQQYKDAGLSPSLMFSGGGIGGQTTQGAQGGGASGISPNVMPMSIQDIANLELTKAQTEKTKAEADAVKPMTNATVASLLADAGYKKAAEAATAAQTEGIKLDNYVKENTKDASIYMICELAEKAGHDAEKAYYEMKNEKLLEQFNRETFDDRKKLVHEQIQQVVQSICESKAFEKLHDQQRAYLKDQILQNISMTMLEWNKHELSVDQFEAFIEKQIPILEKELDVQLEKLGIERRKLVINAVTDTFKSLAMGAMAASSMGIGKGGNLSPKVDTSQKINSTFELGTKPKGNTNFHYKKGQTSIWEF